MVIVNEIELNYDEVNDTFTNEMLNLTEESVNEAWEKYVEWTSLQGKNNE
ncbi:hypothetical protein G17_00313 [Escherichia phage vB_EcoM_G17]|nr:hypothetical protein [Escherichia coli]MED6826695.1 hypothetical protein [Escherichia coli O157]QBO61802.1 hypothetical protein G17_00313 [Escherichia phage vB_EcoM_G17]WIL00863.1 structural protein [Escherichia phage vB_EcoM_CRJP21]WNN14629.1 hypothetical protein Sharanji_gp348 [Escherichia phage Sharanji]